MFAAPKGMDKTAALRGGFLLIGRIWKKFWKIEISVLFLPKHNTMIS